MHKQLPTQKLLPNPYTLVPGSNVFRPRTKGPQTIIIPDSVRGTTTFNTTAFEPWTITSSPSSSVQINLADNYGKFLTTVFVAAGTSVTLTPQFVPAYRSNFPPYTTQPELGQKLQVHADFPLASGAVIHHIDAVGWYPPGWNPA